MYFSFPPCLYQVPSGLSPVVLWFKKLKSSPLHCTHRIHISQKVSNPHSTNALNLLQFLGLILHIEIDSPIPKESNLLRNNAVSWWWERCIPRWTQNHIFIYILRSWINFFLKRACNCTANINANNTITGSSWFTVTLVFLSVILASGDEEWSWLGVDCWGQSNDECLTVDGSENGPQMAAGVVSFQIFEGTRQLLCSLRWRRRRKVFHFISSSYFNCIPFTKELEKSTRKFSQPLLIHTSNRSVNYLVFVSFFGKGGKMVNRCSRHAFVERVTLIQGYPKASSLPFK